MKMLNLLITAVTAGLLSMSVSALPDRVGDFGLIDSDGEFHQLSRYRNMEALVLLH